MLKECLKLTSLHTFTARSRPGCWSTSPRRTRRCRFGRRMLRLLRLLMRIRDARGAPIPEPEPEAETEPVAAGG